MEKQMSSILHPMSYIYRHLITRHFRFFTSIAPFILMSSSLISRNRRPRRALTSCTYCLEGILFISLFIATRSFTTVYKSIQQHIHPNTLLDMVRNRPFLVGDAHWDFTTSTSSSIFNPPTLSMILDYHKQNKPLIKDSIYRKARSKFGGPEQNQSTLLSMTLNPITTTKDQSILGFDIENTLMDNTSPQRSTRVSTIDPPSSLESLQEGQYLSKTMKIKNDFEHWRNSTSLRRSLQRMTPKRTHRMHAFSPIKKTHASGGFSIQPELKKNHILEAEATRTPLLDNSQHSSPLWLPYLPTQTQIQELKLMELKAACQDRGLSTGGKKADLQSRLTSWSNEEQIRRVFERNNAFEAYLASDTVYEREQVDPQSKDGANSRGNRVDATVADSIEPLINRRKSLLLSRDLSKQSNHPSTTQQKSTNRSFVDSTEAILGENSTRQRIKRAKTNPIQEKDADISVDRLTPTKDYLSSLTRSFYESNVHSNNYQIQQLYLRAKHSDQAGDLETAKALLQDLRIAAPRDLRVVRRLARLESQKGNFIEARSILKSALETFPKESHLLQGLGTLEVKCGNLDLARNYFREAIKNLPTFPNPYHALATLEHSCGNIRLATSVLRLGLKHCPSNHRLYHAMGDLYLEAMMLDLAESSYRKGLDCIASQTDINGKNLNWANSFFFLSLSYIAFEKGDSLECRRWLKKSFSSDVNELFSQGWIALARFEESQGHIDNARSTYSDAANKYESIRKTKALRLAYANENFLDSESISPLRMSDRWTHLYTSWARFEETFGSYSDANNVYSRAMMAFPHDISMLLSWAKFQAKNNRVDRARTLFELACDKSSCNSADPYRLYAEFEMRSGNYKRARSIFYLGAQSLSEAQDGAISLNQSFSRLFLSWAVCEWHLGNWERAEVIFDHALRLTEESDEGLELRSLLLFSIARFLYHARKDYPLAQHCICLCLKDNRPFNHKVNVWYLWSRVAQAMNNKSVSDSCLREVDILEKEKSKLNDLPQLNSKDMQQLLRRAPWDSKTVMGASETSWYDGIRFPDMVFFINNLS